MPLYEYECNSCSNISEHLRPVKDRANEATCPDCGETASFKISTPRIKLDPICGDFGGATEKWERMHKKQAEIERKRELS